MCSLTSSGVEIADSFVFKGSLEFAEEELSVVSISLLKDTVWIGIWFRILS